MALNPNPGPEGIPYDGKTDFLIPLFNAAQSTAAAQALLSPAPRGKSSNLQYLLHDRARIWANTDHGDALGGLMQRAMTGRDPASMQLFQETVAVLGTDVRHWVTGDGSHLKVINQTALDQLRELRYLLAGVLAAHLDDIIPDIAGSVSTGGIAKGSLEKEQNLAALIAFATSDDTGFWDLVKAQIGHTKVWLDQQLASGRGVQEGLTQEAINLSFILTLREGMLIAQQPHADDTQNLFLKQLVEKGIGYIPVPYAGLLGDVVKANIEEVAHSHYSQVGDWLVDQVSPIPEVPDSSKLAMSNEQAVMSLISQMLLSPTLAHLHYSAADVADKSFAKDGEILPANTWNDDQLKSFMNWCKEQNIPVSSLGAAVKSTIDSTKGAALGVFNDTKGSTQP